MNHLLILCRITHLSLDMKKKTDQLYYREYMLTIISQKDILGFNQNIHHRGTGNCILILCIDVFLFSDFFFVKDFLLELYLNME